MAAPLRQNIALSDTVRMLSGDSAGLVAQLRKEREKLEREIARSLDSAGRADKSLTERLGALRLRETEAGGAAIAAGRVDGLRGVFRGFRGDARDVGGLFELLRGGVSAGNLRDLAGVSGMASDYLARSGRYRAASMVGRLGGVATAAGAVFGAGIASAATAYAGYEFGKGVGNFLFGDPEEMKARAGRLDRFAGSVWNAREQLGTERTAELLGRGTYRRAGLFGGTMRDADPWASVDLLRTLNGRAGREAVDKAIDRHERELGKSGRVARGWRRLKDWVFLTQEAEETDAEDVHKRAADDLQKRRDLEKARIDAFNKSPEGVRSRAVLNERMHALRALEEERFTRSQDWSAY